MSPQEFVKRAIETNSVFDAVKIASKSVQTMREVMETGGSVPYYEEVEISTDDKGRDRITIDEAAKLKRLKKLQSFWTTTLSLLQKEEVKLLEKQKKLRN